jgi:hypothetical protein
MTTVSILRQLRRKRWLVLCAAVLALLVGYAVAFKPATLQSSKYQVGTATVRVLVDTPSSQIVAVDPAGTDLLSEHANLLASLMVEGVVKSEIARDAGLRPGQVYGVAQSITPDPSQPATTTPNPRGYSLTTNVLNDTDPNASQLPIIEIDTQAPTAAGAARLANAAVAGVQAYLSSQAATEAIPEAHRIRLTSLGPPQATDGVRGSHNALALGLAALIFLAGCGLIVLFPRLVRDWRAASEPPGPLETGRWLRSSENGHDPAPREAAPPAAPHEPDPATHPPGRRPMAAPRLLVERRFSDASPPAPTRNSSEEPRLRPKAAQGQRSR